MSPNLTVNIEHLCSDCIHFKMCKWKDYAEQYLGGEHSPIFTKKLASICIDFEVRKDE